ncbi:unnamed protein product, partial [Amoebophrya sp. A25]|eukprot:GSA25T00002268001.1
MMEKPEAGAMSKKATLLFDEKGRPQLHFLLIVLREDEMTGSTALKEQTSSPPLNLEERLGPVEQGVGENTPASEAGSTVSRKLSVSEHFANEIKKLGGHPSVINHYATRPSKQASSLIAPLARKRMAPTMSEPSVAVTGPSHAHSKAQKVDKKMDNKRHKKAQTARKIQEHRSNSPPVFLFAEAADAAKQKQ